MNTHKNQNDITVLGHTLGDFPPGKLRPRINDGIESDRSPEVVAFMESVRNFTDTLFLIAQNLEKEIGYGAGQFKADEALPYRNTDLKALHEGQSKDAPKSFAELVQQEKTSFTERFQD